MEELKKSNKIKQLKRVEKEKINKAEQEEKEKIYRVILCITKFNRGSNLHIASLLRCIY